MNDAQRKRYIAEAKKAFQNTTIAIVGPADVDGTRYVRRDVRPFKSFRDAEKHYALGAPKNFSDLTQMDLTRCLIHFRALQHSERLTFEQITELANARQETGLLESFREQWDAIEPSARAKVMRQRHNILFFEELATLDPVDVRFVRITLTRLAKEYPSQTSRAEALAKADATERTPCTTD